MKKIKFKCPKCGNKFARVEQVDKGFIYYELKSLEKLNSGLVNIEYSLSAIEEPVIDPQECIGFECSACGYVLNGVPSDYAINTPEELYKWLEDRDMLEEYHP